MSNMAPINIEKQCERVARWNVEIDTILESENLAVHVETSEEYVGEGGECVCMKIRGEKATLAISSLLKQNGYETRLDEFSGVLDAWACEPF